MSASPPTEQGTKRSERALIIGVLTTSLSLVPTFYAAWISNSIVLLGDLLRCSVEYLSIWLAFLIVRRINRGSTINFHYGFGRLEQLSGLAVAISLFFASACVTFSGILRLLNPQPLIAPTFGLGLAALSVLGNLILCAYYISLNKHKPSPLLYSQARLFRAKTTASFVVLISLSISILDISPILTFGADPIGSLILAIFLFRSGMDLMTSSMNDLVDSAIDEAAQLTILRVLIKHDSIYSGLDRIRSRRSGTRIFIELFLQFEPSITIQEVSSRTETIKGSIQEFMPNSDITIIAATTKP